MDHNVSGTENGSPSRPPQEVAALKGASAQGLVGTGPWT